MISNMNDIRAILCDEIEKIRAGKTTASNVNAVCNAAGKLIGTIKLELEYAKLTNQKPPNNSFIALNEAKLGGPIDKPESV